MDQVTLRKESAKILSELEVRAPECPMLYGHKIFSQCDEDGIIAHLLGKIKSFAPLTHTFIEFGCGNGLENNTHALLLTGFSGCWIDGEIVHTQEIEISVGLQRHDLMTIHERVSIETLPSILERCLHFLGTENLDFLSMDLDGNDWYFVRQILEYIKPKLICVEYNGKFPPFYKLVMDYDADHKWAGDDYYGASLASWVELLDGYTLVSCNLSGVNAFFVHNEYTSLFPLYPVEVLYQPPRYEFTALMPGHRPSMKWLAHKSVDKQTEEGKIQAIQPGKRSFPFYIHPQGDPFISTLLKNTGKYETFETALFINSLKAEDFVLDIGANIGWYTAIAALCIGNRGEIRAYEPSEANFSILINNISSIQKLTGHKIKAQQIAISNKNGEANLFLAAENLGDHRIFPDIEERIAEKIQICSLDSIFFTQNRWPDVVKIDTQGAEGKIMEGASHLFNNNWRPLIFMEFWPYGLKKAGSNPLEVYDFLKKLNYNCFEINSAEAKIISLDRVNLIQKISTPGMDSGLHYLDFMLVPEGSTRTNILMQYIKKL